MPENNPIPDAELVELRRQCGLTQADFAAVNRHLVLAAIARLEAAERERERIVVEAQANCDAATARAEAAESTVAGLRRALEEIANDGVERSRDPRTILARTALAASPDEHERRIKSEALRATAKELEDLRDHIQTEIGPDDARDDIRRVCWNRAKDLREEADRLEAANATTNT